MRKTARDLKRREFEFCLKTTICDVKRLFGYSKLPHVFETKLPGNEMMSFITIRNGKYSAIAYDYQKIAALFSRYDKEDAIARIVFITAHEMRHYYQHRQIRAKSSRESVKTVNAWRKSDVIRIDCDNSEYYGNVREIDAFAFAYSYVADKFGVLVVNVGVPKKYRMVMKRYVKKTFGLKAPIFSAKYDKYFY